MADIESVSVVIPTTGRPELVRAAASVRAQHTSADVELIVVFDGTPDAELPAEIHGIADRVIRTAGRTGGANARNLGIRASHGEFIALLDDDDEWLPAKLALQLSLIRASPAPEQTVVAGRHVHVDARSGAVTRASPDRLISPDQSVSQYLFRRRKPSIGRASMYTSTLLCSRDLAASVPWDAGLSRHQDWDWLIRLGQSPGVRFAQVAEPVVRIQTGSADSISASSDWSSSLQWAAGALRDDPAVHADFLAAQPLRYALQARDWSGVRRVLGAIARSRRLPSFGPIAIGAAGVLSRRSLEQLMIVSRNPRS